MDPLAALVQKHAPSLSEEAISDQTTLPRVAKAPLLLSGIRAAVAEVETHHRLILGDARAMPDIADQSVHLIVTSPPYWTLKEYNGSPGQLATIDDYEAFNDALALVWHEAHRVLIPGGRMIIVVGDVCLSRRRYGRHVVFPLHATIQERCRLLGFDNLAPIIWYKIANAQYEAGGGRFLGKPYEPNAIIKNDVEYILIQRKPGPYRKPSAAMRALSVISAEEYQEWFQQIWRLSGASTRAHPAPFPVALAERLVRMYSFVGDTVLDPFAGSGSTTLACARCGRSSIGVEVDADYVALSETRIRRQVTTMFSKACIEVTA